MLPPTQPKQKAEPPALGFVPSATIKAAQEFTIPRGALRSNFVVAWYCKPGTCYEGYKVSGGIYTSTQGKGWFEAYNPTGPTAMTTTWLPASMTTTFPYFRWSAYTTGGEPTPSATYRARGNYDAPQRGGSMKVWTGAKRFGGTTRWLFGPNGFWVQEITRETPWRDKAFFPATQWQRTSLSPRPFGERESGGYGYRLRYTFKGDVPVTSMGTQITFKAQYLATNGNWSTGKARAYQSLGTYVTTLTFSGYDNRDTPTVAYGNRNMSMVRPHLRHSYVTRNDGSATEYTWAASRVYGMHVYFSPEPGAVLMLGVGVATLAGLVLARRRRH
jgi:hypothetical protein